MTDYILKIRRSLSCLAFLALVSCNSDQRDGAGEQSGITVYQPDRDIAYRGFVHEVTLIFRDEEMYSGVLPMWSGDSAVDRSFVPIVRDLSDFAGAECIYPAPPMDSYGGTIAFGKPPNLQFEGSFTCGKFRFDVQRCSALEAGCVGSYIKVFSLPNKRFVNFQLWDECRGIFLISNASLEDVTESWMRADYPVGGYGIFGSGESHCMTRADYPEG